VRPAGHFADGVVRYVGEPIAVVVADSTRGGQSMAHRRWSTVSRCDASSAEDAVRDGAVAAPDPGDNPPLPSVTVGDPGPRLRRPIGS
jgi:hypothetical protein